MVFQSMCEGFILLRTRWCIISSTYSWLSQTINIAEYRKCHQCSFSFIETSDSKHIFVLKVLLVVSHESRIRLMDNTRWQSAGRRHLGIFYISINTWDLLKTLVVRFAVVYLSSFCSNDDDEEERKKIGLINFSPFLILLFLAFSIKYPSNF